MADYSITSAVRVLRERKIPFEPHFYTYEVHGGTKHAAVPVHMERSVLVLPRVFINGGKMCLLVQLKLHVVAGALEPVEVTVAIPGGGQKQEWLGHVA